MGSNVPQFVSRSVPVPPDNRSPWYRSTFPTYFGIFLWVGFYLKVLAGPTLTFADVGVCLAGLAVAGAASLRSTRTTCPPCSVCRQDNLSISWQHLHSESQEDSIPGLLMGALQIGWVAVITSISATFIMTGLGQTSPTLFAAIVLVWLYSLGWVAVRGIHHINRVAKFMNWLPLEMVLIVVCGELERRRPLRGPASQRARRILKCADDRDRVLRHCGCGRRRL